MKQHSLPDEIDTAPGEELPALPGLPMDPSAELEKLPLNFLGFHHYLAQAVIPIYRHSHLFFLKKNTLFNTDKFQTEKNRDIKKFHCNDYSRVDNWILSAKSLFFANFLPKIIVRNTGNEIICKCQEMVKLLTILFRTSKGFSCC